MMNLKSIIDLKPNPSCMYDFISLTIYFVYALLVTKAMVKY